MRSSESSGAGDRAKRGVASLIVVILGGIAGFLIAYWVWRGVLGIPFELRVSLHMDNQGSNVRPWAPWWVPTGIMTVITMLLWRMFAIRARKISLLGGAIAMTLAAGLTFVIAGLCLNLGAVMQYDPVPAFGAIVRIVPLMLLEGVGLFMAFMMVGNFVILIDAALIGLMIAALGRLIYRITDPRVGSQAA